MKAFRLCLTVLTLVLTAQPAHSAVERFEITSRAPFADGKKFGDVGAYERIDGVVHFTLDPKARQNLTVVDLQHAPKSKDGLVRYSADLSILAPKDLKKASGALLYDVNNRGNKMALRFFNFSGGGNDPRSAQHAGDGFLMKQGIVIVWSGWIGELRPGNNRLQLRPPSTSASKDPLDGPVRYELFTARAASTITVNGDSHGVYQPVDPLLEKAWLTHRRQPRDARIYVPRSKWKATIEKPASKSDFPKMTVTLDGGFEPGVLYELIYRAKNPRVMGTGLTGVRDLISSLRYGDGKNNPLLLNGKPVIKRTHGFGVSQSGRFLRELVYWGLNEDEQGRKAFDAVIPHVSGGGLGSFNYRFCQPTAYNTQFRQHDYPSDRFPFAYETQFDSLSNLRDGIQKRCAASALPYIFHTQSSSEYWHRSGSLAHTDTLGKTDSKIPDNVRIYIFGGTQHGPSNFPPSTSGSTNAQNPGDYRFFLRSLLLRLDQWVADGKRPPASVYPTIAAGNLVQPNRKGTTFPMIPGVDFPRVIQQPSLWDLGPRWNSQFIVDREPPNALADYATLVPKSNADGNELGCLNPPEIEVPVASYTGWNLISDGTSADGNLVGLRGSYIPFPRTKKERIAKQDPRVSVQERYASLDTYIKKMNAYCERLVESGYLVESDVPGILEIHKKRAAPLFD